MRALCFLVAAALVLAAPAELPAQSLFGGRGLGVPVAPVDARARALGGIGIGLLDFNPAFANPADAADVQRRGLVAAIQPTTRSMEFDGERDDVDATRFPLLRFFQPFGQRAVISAGYGAFMDQTWSVVQEGSTMIGDRSVATRDLIRSTGGLSQLQVGAAYRLTESLALGAAGGLYTGSLTREVVRSFPDAEPGEFQPFTLRSGWSYLAPMAAAGVRWDPIDVLRVAGSVTWSGDLRVRNDEGVDQHFHLPLRVAAGASGLLTPRLVGALSARWSGWGESEAFEEGASDTWELGGGLEWTGIRVRERPLPVRIGFHRSTLPFRIDGEQPSERAAAFGVGARFGGIPATPLGRFDATVERGTRAGEAVARLSEDFWRITASVSIFGP
jgi:hypothetical protein